MKYNNKKRGFTLIELMSVIAIIAILSVVLWSTVEGYINRSKKLNVVVQSRNVVEYATSV
jgi:type IV pilus assembly protein PilA